MNRSFICVVLIAFLRPAVAEGSGVPCSAEKSPKQTVEQLWISATRGELLSLEGWEKARRSLFAEQSTMERSKIIRVISNYWVLSQEKVHEDKAEVIVNFTAAGTIDSELRYTAPSSSDPIKEGMLFHLVCAPSHYSTFKSEGNKLLVDKTITGPPAWQIEGRELEPFATVNTAIRYVLEIRQATQDPRIKKHADATLSHLLRFQ